MASESPLLGKIISNSIFDPEVSPQTLRLLEGSLGLFFGLIYAFVTSKSNI